MGRDSSDAAEVGRIQLKDILQLIKCPNCLLFRVSEVVDYDRSDLDYSDPAPFRRCGVLRMVHDGCSQPSFPAYLTSIACLLDIGAYRLDSGARGRAPGLRTSSLCT